MPRGAICLSTAPQVARRPNVTGLPHADDNWQLQPLRPSPSRRAGIFPATADSGQGAPAAVSSVRWSDPTPAEARGDTVEILFSRCLFLMS